MLTKITELCHWLGWTRDDAKWAWSQVTSAAAAVAMGIFNIPYWAAYVGLTVTTNEVHVITVIAVAILWISGKMDSSSLQAGLKSRSTSGGSMLPETLEDRIKRHEGLLLTPYLDTTGHWTIGYGHEITSSVALMYRSGITQAKAEEILQEDIASHQTALLKALPWLQGVGSIRQGVFVELCFEVGLVGLLGFHRTLTDAEDGNWVKCSTDMLLSEWAVQTKGRAIEMAQILRQG